MATDEAGLQSQEASVTYKTVPIVGVNGRSAWDPMMGIAKDNFLFTAWGTATVLDQDSFLLREGSAG